MGLAESAFLEDVRKVPHLSATPVEIPTTVDSISSLPDPPLPSISAPVGIRQPAHDTSLPTVGTVSSSAASSQSSQPSGHIGSSLYGRRVKTLLPPIQVVEDKEKVAQYKIQWSRAVAKRAAREEYKRHYGEGSGQTERAPRRVQFAEPTAEVISYEDRARPLPHEEAVEGAWEGKAVDLTPRQERWISSQSRLDDDGSYTDEEETPKFTSNRYITPEVPVEGAWEREAVDLTPRQER